MSATAAIIAGGAIGAASSLGSTGINALQQKYNRDHAAAENKKNRKFQKEMAQNNIKYAVQQAKDLGISPSLILGDQTNSLGGSSVGAGGSSHVADTSGINSVINAITEQNRLKTMEEMNEDKLNTMKEIQLSKINNSVTNTNKNEYYERNKAAIESLKNNFNNFDW